MSSAVRRSILAVVTVVVLLALGAGVAVVVTDALGIRAEPAVQMQPEPPAGAPAMAVVAPPRFTMESAIDGTAGVLLSSADLCKDCLCFPRRAPRR